METQYPWLNLVHYIHFVENYLGLFGVNQTLVGWLKIFVTSCSFNIYDSFLFYIKRRVLTIFLINRDDKNIYISSFYISHLPMYICQLIFRVEGGIDV